VLVVMVCVYIFALEPWQLSMYHQWIRPALYVLLAVIVYAYFGRGGGRRVRKAYQANLAAAISIALYAITFIVLAFVQGAGINADTPNRTMRIWHITTVGSVVIMREIIRYKLIKQTGDKDRAAVVALLIIVLALAQLDDLRVLYMQDVLDPYLFFFATVLPGIMVSVVVSYIAVEGSFLAVISMSLVYSMGALLMPIFPHIEPLPWALTVSALLFVSAFIFRAAMNDKSPAQKKREKLRAKYFSKKPWLMNSLTFGIIGLVVLFFLGVFPIYPVAILTDSMAGTFEQGSLVFVRRVPPGKAYDMVGEGYIIHFRQGRLEFVHRAVEFVYGKDGRREYITQGDASYLRDPWQTGQDDVLGIAVTFLPFLGWPYVVVHFLRV